MRFLHPVVVVLLVFSVAATSYADTSGRRVVYRLDDTPAKRVLIDKSERKLTLLLKDGRKKQFDIGLGGEPEGHKWRKGDSRTPEGDYFIDLKNFDSEYYLSVRISYPNERDLATAQRLGVEPGGQIMIHGYPNDARPPYEEFKGKDWTDGCIAVSNFAMQEIWLAVRESTPVSIRP